MSRRGRGRPMVLITGASGLIGSRITADLARDYTVVGLDVVEPREVPDGTAWRECDLTSDESVRDALDEVRERFGTRIASVIHLAAYYDFKGEPSPLYLDLTVRGTRRLLRGLRDFDVDQFVFSSTLLVMKPAGPGEVLDERSPLQAEWDYPRSKLAAEQAIAEERGGTPAVIHRLAGAYDEDGHSPPLAQHIRRIHERRLESYFFPGDPRAGSSFIHLDDVVSLFRCTVEARGELDPWEVFLAGEDEALSHRELQALIGEATHHRRWPTLRIPAPAAKLGAWLQAKAPFGEDPFIKPWMIELAAASYPVSIRRARERLGWEPRHRLRDTIFAMVDRLHEDPRRFYALNGLPWPGAARAAGAPALTRLRVGVQERRARRPALRTMVAGRQGASVRG